MKHKKWVPVLAVLLIAAMVTGACRVEDVIPRGTYNTDVYVEQGGAKLVVESGGEIEMQSGSTLDVQSGTTVGFGGDMDVTGALDVDGLTDLDTVDIDDLVNITRVTGTTGQYEDLVLAEWTNSAADATKGSNGIYMSTNPIYNVQNVYGLRARLDLRGASAAVDVNQLHGVDALINLNETQVYTLTDNISAVGVAIHGGTSGDVIADAEGDPGSLNLYYGVYGPTATVNHTVQTNGMLLMMHDATYVDYGLNIQSSADMDAGLYLNSHASNAGAKMDVGVEMTSGAGDMVNGIDMEAADFTGSDIVGDSGETLDNTTDTAWVIGGFIAATEGVVIDLANGGTITPTATYQPITNATGGSITTSTSIAIADGPVEGAILILVNEDAQDIVIDDGANTLFAGNITLTGGANDTLTLIWNGSDWVGVAFIDN